MEENKNLNVGFWKWFFTIKWLKIPMWIWIVVGSFSNSAKLLNANPNYPIGGVLFDAMGGIVFCLLIFVAWFYLVTKRKMSKK